jgi:multidrug transporter EmrE-like cation transporter
MSWLILVLSIASNAGASMLVKVGMARLPEDGDRLRATATNPWLLIGVVLYGVAFLTYAMALRLFPLNLAHPVLTAGAITMVAIGSVLWFGESLPSSAILGLALILTGVILISWRPF